MTGLEISQKYFETYGKPLLEEKFADIIPLLAVGLVGSGSECFGFDDEISRDHDFEPGFCIFLPDEDILGRKEAFELERAYARLPKEFMGLTRSMLNPAGGARHGVIRTSEFYKTHTGSADGILTIGEWFSIPEQNLAEATNGKIFSDNYGNFTKIRNSLINYPFDVFLKKLAGNLALMAQSGQYNYQRCIEHGETASAQLAVIEFVKSAMHACFLLSGKYMPFYKWQFRALSDCSCGADLAENFEYLLTTDNSDFTYGIKNSLIEKIASEIIIFLQDKNLTDAICGDLQKHANSVNDKIEDAEIRNMNILSAVSDS